MCMYIYVLASPNRCALPRRSAACCGVRSLCLAKLCVECQKVRCILLHGIVCIFSPYTCDFLTPYIYAYIRKSDVSYCMASYAYSHPTPVTFWHPTHMHTSESQMYSTAWHLMQILTVYIWLYAYSHMYISHPTHLFDEGWERLQHVGVDARKECGTRAHLCENPQPSALQSIHKKKFVASKFSTFQICHRMGALLWSFLIYICIYIYIWAHLYIIIYIYMYVCTCIYIHAKNVTTLALIFVNHSQISVSQSV